MDQDLEFNVAVRRDERGLVVVPEGEIDLATADAVRAGLSERDGADPVVLDLRGVTFLDTSGLQLILETQRAAQKDGFSFVLVRAQARVQHLFEIAGLAAQLTFVDDPAEASALGRPAAG